MIAWRSVGQGVSLLCILFVVFLRTEVCGELVRDELCGEELGYPENLWAGNTYSNGQERFRIQVQQYDKRLTKEESNRVENVTNDKL
jgi:hypothetical protein